MHTTKAENSVFSLATPPHPPPSREKKPVTPKCVSDYCPRHNVGMQVEAEVLYAHALIAAID